MLWRKTAQYARAEQHPLAALGQPQERQGRIAQVIERPEKQRQIVITVELEPEVDVALDDATRVTEEVSASLDAAAVVEVRCGVIEKIDVTLQRLKQEPHIAVCASDVQHATVIRKELRGGIHERVQVVDVVETVVRVPVDIGACLAERKQPLAESRNRGNEIGEAHATLH